MREREGDSALSREKGGMMGERAHRPQRRSRCEVVPTTIPRSLRALPLPRCVRRKVQGERRGKGGGKGGEQNGTKLFSRLEGPKILSLAKTR